jgi:hypothetical protein
VKRTALSLENSFLKCFEISFYKAETEEKQRSGFGSRMNK